jgi:hypothetical protein
MRRLTCGMLLPQLTRKVFSPVSNEDGLTDEEHLKAATELFRRGLKPDEPAQSPEEVLTG